jgi:hypothetical protein
MVESKSVLEINQDFVHPSLKQVLQDNAEGAERSSLRCQLFSLA